MKINYLIPQTKLQRVRIFIGQIIHMVILFLIFMKINVLIPEGSKNNPLPRFTGGGHSSMPVKRTGLPLVTVVLVYFIG